MSSLNIGDLRTAFDRLLDAVEDTFGPELSLPVDHYWGVSLGAVFDLERTPELDVGQVSDDLESIRELARASSSEMTVIWHECEHVAGLLRAISFLDRTQDGPPTTRDR
ncbi:MAG TPA: hypothetical protein VIP77_06020 [Jiangellaceae bacterium]